MRATATDKAGNTSLASGEVSMLVDTKAPGIPTLVVKSPTNDSRPEFTGEAEAGVRVTLRMGVEVIGEVMVDESGNYSYKPETEISDGSYEVTATATDKAGNTSLASGEVSMLVDTKPTEKWAEVVVYPNLPTTVLAEVKVKGEAVSEGSLVGAFAGEELRGVKEVVLAGGKSYVTLNVNLEGTEQVSFRIWEENLGEEFEVADSMELGIGKTYGTASALVQLNADDKKVLGVPTLVVKSPTKDLSLIHI